MMSGERGMNPVTVTIINPQKEVYQLKIRTNDPLVESHVCYRQCCWDKRVNLPNYYQWQTFSTLQQNSFERIVTQLMETRKILRRRQNQANRLKALGTRTDLSTTRKMQNPPLIMPNYGKRKSVPGVPKTKMSRVLLYDNVTQQHMLDVKVAHIKIEKERVERLFDLHIRSFSARMAMKRRQTSLSANLSNETPEITKPPLQRNQTIMSDKERVSSALPIEKFRFPKLEKPGKEIALNLQTRSGKNRTYYSSDESGLFQNLIPLYKFYSDVTEDPRFTKLESLLLGTK